MPLTRNGKLDRKGLPQPERRRGGEGYVGPRNAEEEMLCGVWEQLLGAERVGVEDNFFELGGHSLLATQVMSRVRKVLGVEVAVRVLFERPTVRGMVEGTEEARAAQARDGRPPLVKANREGALPLSYAQQRLWFIHNLEPDSPAYNIPLALRLKGPLDVHALRLATAEIVHRHDVFRTRFEMVNGAPVQVIEPFDEKDQQQALRQVDLTGLDGPEQEAEVRQLSLAEAVSPFDLKCGKVLRTCLLTL